MGGEEKNKVTYGDHAGSPRISITLAACRSVFTPEVLKSLLAINGITGFELEETGETLYDATGNSCVIN